MPRYVMGDRLQHLIESATSVFIARGYRQTQMADVATKMGVAKGSLYTYVESKDALFDLVVRCADRDDWRAKAPELPVPTSSSESTLQYIRQRLAQAETMTNLAEALNRKRVRDSSSELRAIMIELYGLLASNRYGITLIDRSSRDYPELAALWLDTRSGLLKLLRSYLESRIASGHLRPVPDTAVAARLLLETATFWAVHRHWDLRPEPISDSVARDTVVHFAMGALVKV
jgi:AcrR family transcriptional regulator